MTDLALAIAHHLLIFSLAAILAAELASVRLGLRAMALSRLALVDAHYGLIAGLILIVGFLRVYFGVKGPDAYLPNPWFWAKIGAFLVVGLLSVPPTLQFMKWRRAAVANPDFSPDEAAVRGVRRFLIAELALFLFIPAFAAVMARYGY
jgi:putative membrane protein